MSYSAHLWVFFLLVFGAVILPGMDMAFILGSALTGGRRHGFAAVAGAVAGAACHSIFVALGIGLLLEMFPWAFDALLLAGACFIAWIAIDILRAAPPRMDARMSAPTSPWRTFRREVANNLLNPHAYLFTLAVFPQFILPDSGPVALQAFVLFLIIAATQTFVYGTIVLLAAQVRQWLAEAPRAQTAMRAAVGVLLLAVALWAGYSGWQRI